ncbi:5-(carboxyamino)imidazole ribonucleotide synthase [Virgibacillus pantothenticus]|uniref:5-(carboxyamino)imidazole ribonucleotide synthase n=1 Tax=Virgibacillus pantothenticus TaxID=1473 RepID=UPI001C2505E6|nr:5-(carboxyamino)imidazole ribonucleotide synthase [Virgibacillus pantothenticus]MBU8568418.1 5-(carboxyamino)imidazole ribonucleotide synthase [Virgibacillus pantothenticus]MBU8602398.1 5-(carboxyamino)imidazole ribonucleotide synthase [Virgibacillus pantothenticus]MBU8636534.1 5-(carboxyamino)imidazole ribonucleotide synthase [Virgibacillus pantothenticus]MBU8644215.1 5-(carboxyamino)imidazole ribonucleotide synthase [Virgibacillus pantothenticus]MBU8648987.1 5-(carboxyamino)imidazole ribo
MQRNNGILPPKTIGIIGGGQLGRMMAIAAKYMGYRIAVLDPTADCPTAQVADHSIVAAYDDMEAIKKLAEVSDVITYEFENVNLPAAAFLEQQGKLPQGAYALEVTQNREKEKTVMQELGLPVAPFAIVRSAEECEQVFHNFPLPAVIKTCRGGYDGKGQLKIEDASQIAAACAFAEEHCHCIIEQWLSFDKEVSVIFTRSQTGEITFFPIAENEHRNHILYQTSVPAAIPKMVERRAMKAVEKLAHHMNIVGTFAVELFIQGEAIYMNEMAPRPHNSGHYTIEACTVSQFMQHIRAICQLPLLEVSLLQSAIMVNVLGAELEEVVQLLPKAYAGFVHLYGKKSAKPNRKMGHITFIGDTIENVQQQMKTFWEAK